MKKVLRTILLLAWMILIYSFSAQNGTASLDLSDGILYSIGTILNRFIVIDVYAFVKNFAYLMRKTAHFAEYFILYVLAYGCFKEYDLKRADIISLVLCVVYAFFDEFHQLFVDGRSGQLIDSLIDSFAAACAFLLWHKRKR